MEFNRIIKLLRTERGITQKQAAEDLHISQALLSHYEKGIRECGLDFVVRVADYYPNPDKMKDNVYHGSVLPTMNKKLISNSLNVLYAKVGQCRNKALVTEVSAYLMMAVYKMFRLLYASGPHNAASMFSIGEGQWDGYADAVMRMAEANVSVLLAGGSVKNGEGLEDTAPLAMTTESLTREFPLYTSSLLNLVKTSETRIRSLTPPEETR